MMTVLVAMGGIGTFLGWAVRNGNVEEEVRGVDDWCGATAKSLQYLRDRIRDRIRDRT